MDKIGKRRVLRKKKDLLVKLRPASFRLSDNQRAKIYRKFETIQAFFNYCYKSEFARKRKDV